jgi:hypothetical protein
MFLEYRMSTNSGSNSGFLGLGELFGKATNAVKKVIPGKNNTHAPNNSAVKPVTAGTNMPPSNSTAPSMKGGMASINYRSGMQQPSEAVMKWATTAGAAMPPAAQMRGVAHGGRRSRRRGGRKTIGRRYRKSKRATGGRRRKTNKRKTHRRRRN